MIGRRLLGVLLALALLTPVVTMVGSASAVAAPRAAAQRQAVSRAEAIHQLTMVRASIDQTLELVEQGKIGQAYAQAKTGYLDHFEYVEVSLRVVAPDLTDDAETQFAEIRDLVRSGASVGTVRASIVELRRLMDDIERRLTDTGFAAVTVVAGQSFLVIFREGLEAVLLSTALLGYLEATKSTRHRRPIAWGVILGLVATAPAYLLLRYVLAMVPAGREALEVVVAAAAVAVLLYVPFWLVARPEHRRWMEFLRSRLFSAVSVGSTTALVLVGFTGMCREGLETALLYQPLVEFDQGLGWWVVAGLAAGLVALAVMSCLIFRLGRRLPVRTFLVGAVALLMTTSVAFLGNAVRSLQTADLVGRTPLDGLPHAPIFVCQALGYWPSVQTLASQAVLVAVYALGATWLSMVRPRRAWEARWVSG
ncbi:MAG: FTR1 family protein [Pseudonocardiales bacterium]|nr:FTR1 family protein [Pseudonocardiales bacterium]MBV9031363.1 FTR1 family protein [Pseudonocardiales bacterium]MBW0011328.1 FTR1 family protein [Pseudonocardiales bacterium]